MKVESPFLRSALLLLAQSGCTVFRNQVGKGWYGKAEHWNNGSVTIVGARQLTAGLCVGSSDIVGWRSVTITPEMVGKRIAQFVAVEAKSDTGTLTDGQGNFLDAVRDAGGFAVVARDAVGLVDELRRGM